MTSSNLLEARYAELFSNLQGLWLTTTRAMALYTLQAWPSGCKTGRIVAPCWSWSYCCESSRLGPKSITLGSSLPTPSCCASPKVNLRHAPANSMRGLSTSISSSRNTRCGNLHASKRVRTCMSHRLSFVRLQLGYFIDAFFGLSAHRLLHLPFFDGTQRTYQVTEHSLNTISLWRDQQS